MLRIYQTPPVGAYLNDLPDTLPPTMTDPFHYRHIVGNKQVCDTQFSLQVEHQVDDLPRN